MSEMVGKYFHRAAADFDALYEGKGAFGRWLDRRFRRDIYDRFRLTFDACGNVAGKTVLDIGCGTGRYSVEFARRGAARVVGLDLAPNMVSMAGQLAAHRGVKERCDFIAGDFLKKGFPGTFDICVAIGTLDYVSRPCLFLEKMRSLARDCLIVSFPSRSPIRTPVRKARYWLKRCPVYFYDPARIEALIAGLGDSRVVKIPGQGMDYFVSIQMNGAGNILPKWASLEVS